MSKIYLIAVNWDKVKSEHPYSGVSVFDAPTGTDIARYTTNYDVKQWRIYAFTTKRERDALLHNTVDNNRRIK